MINFILWIVGSIVYTREYNNIGKCKTSNLV